MNTPKTTRKPRKSTFMLLVLAACGGAQATSKTEMNAMAKEAPPPPGDVKPGQVVERKVTRETKADFADAVKFFQGAGADGAWTADECTGAAQKFLAVASGEKMFEAYFNAGVAFEKCSDYKKAEDAYQDALKINPSHAPSLANLGEIYLRGGNEARAIQYFDNAIKADGQAGSVAARTNLGWIHYQKLRQTGDKQYETKAFEQLQRALAVDSANVAAYTIMALIFMEGSEKNKNRLDVAQLLLDRGKEQNDKFAPLHHAIGLLAMRKANVKKALDAFRTAAELDPRFIEARMNLAQIVTSFRKYDEAEALFREVLTLNPNAETKYEATVSLGVALRGLGSQLRAMGDIAGSDKKINEAEEQYQAAAKMNSKRGDAYYNLGLLYKDYRTNSDKLEVNKKAYVEARKYFNEFVSKNDGAPDKIAEAKDHISDCDKYVQILDQAIAAQNAPPPPAPAPAPTPAPGGGGTAPKNP